MAGNGSKTPPLRFDGLRVTYGDVVAVKSLDLSLAEGEIYGLIGSNGAGKTSAIKAVMGLVKPSGGNVSVFGHDPVKEGIASRSMVGYVPEVSILYDALTPREFLEFVSSVRKLDKDVVNRRVSEFANALQVDTEMERAISTLSNGTRQKVMIMAALLHQPPLLILDEPFNSLDPRAVRIMKDLLASYVSSGNRSILFSTHTMEVAERLCTRVGILDMGTLKGEGTLSELRASVRKDDATLEDIFLATTTDRSEMDRIVKRLGDA